MRLLAVDPGLSTGWSVLDTDKRPVIVSFGTDRPQAKFYNSLMGGEFNDVDRIVMEDYLIRPVAMKGFQHNWNKPIAVLVMGAVELWAAMYSIPITLQQPAIKPQAAGLTGLPYKKGKADMHHYDSMLHGCYWLIKNKIITPEDIRVKI